MTSTQIAAMQHVSTLCLDNPYLRYFFVQLGAVEFLMNFFPLASKWHKRDRDPLLAHSWRVLTCLSNLDVHHVALEVAKEAKLRMQLDEVPVRRLLEYCR